MKLAVNQKALAGLLDRAKRIVPSRTTIPILNHVVLRAADGRLSIEATDMEVSFRASIEAAIEQPGDLTAAGRQMAEIVSRLSQATVTIDDDASNDVRLTSGRSSYRLSALSAIDFPLLKQPAPTSGEFTVAGAEWARLIERVQHAVIRDNARPMLEGANVSLKDEAFRVVATDGHRLSLAIADTGALEIIRPFEPFTIPSDTLSHMVALAKDATRVRIAVDDRAISMTTESGAVFTSLLLETTYPEWDRLFLDEKPFRVIIDRDELTEAVTRLTSLTSEKSRMLRFSIDAGAVAIETSQSVTEAYGREYATIVGGETLQPCQIGINGRLLQDALSAAPPGPMQVSYADDRSSLHLDIVDYPEWRGLIMPMALEKSEWR